MLLTWAEQRVRRPRGSWFRDEHRGLGVSFLNGVAIVGAVTGIAGFGAPSLAYTILQAVTVPLSFYLPAEDVMRAAEAPSPALVGGESEDAPRTASQTIVRSALLVASTTLRLASLLR